MPTPSSRTPVRIARGTYSNLNSSIADIQEGEICYATDQDKLYVKESSSLVSTQVDLSSEIGSTIQAYDVDTAKTDVAQSFTAAQQGSITTLVDSSGTVVETGQSDIDFSASNNYSLELTGTGRTFPNPTNITAGQSGVITLTQDGTGSRTITTWGSYFKWAGGTAPTLSTGANDLDVLSYYCVSTTVIVASLGADFS